MEKKKIEKATQEKKERKLAKLLREKDVSIQDEQMVKKYSEFLREENLYKYAFKELIQSVVISKDRVINIKFNFNIDKNKKISL